MMFAEKHVCHIIVMEKVDYLAVSTNSVCSTAYFWFPAPWLKINIAGGSSPTATNTPLRESLTSAPWETLYPVWEAQHCIIGDTIGEQ